MNWKTKVSVMTAETKVPERILWEIWRNQNFSKELHTAAGDKLEVLDRGFENTEKGGPDFLNARIRIGNITYVGDIEIDNLQSDWKAHGHNLNKRFNKVILHVILYCDTDNRNVFTHDGRKVLTLCFDKILDEKLNESLRIAIQAEREHKTNKIHCHSLSHIVEEQTKLDFIFELGIERFKKKCEKMLLRLKELMYLSELQLKEPVVRYEIPQNYFEKKYTTEELNKREVWEQLFYEDAFGALGYAQNKNIMLKLAKSANISFLKSLPVGQNSLKVYESVLFNISGLMPDAKKMKKEDTSEYIRELSNIWTNVKQFYDGRKYHESDWHFFRLRPQNFPTIRIAGGARLIDNIINKNLIGNIVSKISRIQNSFLFTNCVKSLLLVKADGYWSKHYVFEKKSNEEIGLFIGTNRADEILINVVFPYLYIYFDLFGKKRLAKKVLRIYSEVNLNTENSLVKEISSSLDIHNSWKRTVIYQGMIELFRSYCSRNRCLECKIGSQVFN